jgi:glycosyltransferase involved in cell wall biosynthesis
MGWDRGVEMISNFTYAKAAEPVTRSEVDTPEDAFVVSTMGRFVPRKGMDVLIKSMSLNNGMYLWIAGDGEEADTLKALATKLGVMDRIRFLGWQKNPNKFVAASDCFAAASSHEPLGNIILEAWAQNVPVVSTRSEGPSWFMTHDEDGLMVDIGDAEGFAKAFTRIQENPQMAERLAQNGMKTLNTTFSKEAITDAYLNLFNRQP